MVFKDCKAERDCKFLFKISSTLYKIVKSGGPLGYLACYTFQSISVSTCIDYIIETPESI